MPKDVDTSRNHFTMGVCMIPHTDKAYKGGEDAFSCAADACMFCLADGVGGWANKGIDSGLYSRELCRQFKDMYEEHVKCGVHLEGEASNAKNTNEFD